MKTNAVFAVIVAVLMAGATVAVAAYGGEVAGANEATVNLDSGGSEPVMIDFSESQYLMSGLSGYTLKWQAAMTDNSWNKEIQSWSDLGDRASSTASNAIGAFTGKTNVAVGNLSLDFDERADGIPNKYLLTIKDSGATAGTSIYLLLKCQVTLSGEGHPTLEPFYYQLTVNVTSNTLTIINSEGFNFVQKQTKEIKIQATADGKSTDGVCTWYATGLPSGLSMSPDGTLGGYPIATTDSNGVDVKLYATNTTTGKIYTATIKVAVSAAEASTGAITIKVNNKEVENSKELSASSTAASITAEGSKGVVIYKVVAVFSDGDITSSTTDSLTVDISGSGKYSITAFGYVDGTFVKKTVTLFVIPAGAGDVQASISASSS